MKIGLGSSLFWMSESHRVSRLGALSITNRECPLLAEERKTFAHIEIFAV